MKKYLRLFYLTAALLLCAFAIPEISEANLPNVTIAVARKESIKETIVCNGVIQETDNEKLSYDVPIFPSSIKVKTGDVVEKGDLLISVDKTQSAAIMASAAGISGKLSNMNIDVSSVPSAVYAPISGRITSMNVQQGKMASPSTTLITIAGNDSMQVVAHVSENQISSIEKEQQVLITGAGFKGQEYTGTVKEISSDAKQIVNGTAMQTVVDVIITIDNADDKLKSGFSSKAEIITAPETEKLIVPYEAVGQDEDGNEFVYIYQNGKAEQRIVTTGKEYNQGFEVLDGISEGQNIVCDISQIKKSGSYVKATLEGAVSA